MKFFKIFYKSPNFWPLLGVLIAGILAGRSLLFESGYFNMHDDLQMMRQLEMEKCLFDGQIPCRWVPDMGYGYGFPLFNFYPPLPYIIGQLFRIVQFSFVDTVKLTFALSFICSGIAMYFLAKEFFGRWGGFISSVFYIWAPYHSVDVYVRGAMNEAWALVWFPLILMTSYRLIKEKEKNAAWIIGLALSWVGLLLSHNLMVLIFTPVFAVWCLMFWLNKKSFKKIIQLAVSGLIALSLAAFFTLPAVFEQKFVRVDTLTQGYNEYIAHYATIGQLLTSRYWGYGPSIWGPNDGMPFQVGHVHWIVSILVLLATFYMVFKRKSTKKTNAEMYYVVFLCFAFGWFAAFMAHQYSTPIWQHIKPLAFVQFPWRFLTLVIFGFSLMAGFVVKFLEPYKKINFYFSALLIILLLAVNWDYFRPLGKHMGPLTDAEKFNGVAWNLQRTAGILDYLPKTAKMNPKDPQTTLAEIVKGKGVVTEAVAGTDWGNFKTDLTENSTVRVNLFEFPTWRITVDGKDVKSYMPDNEDFGRIYIDVPKGQHVINLKLVNTPIRTLGNTVSLTSWLLLITFPLWRKKVRFA